MLTSLVVIVSYISVRLIRSKRQTAVSLFNLSFGPLDELRLKRIIVVVETFARDEYVW